MDVTLIARSPIHIGSGTEYQSQEYIFNHGRAYKPNIDAYFRDNPEQVDAFVEDIEQGRSVGEFIDSIHKYTNYQADQWVSKRDLGRSRVKEFIKTRGEEPYLPGSSLKGAIRTSLAAYALQTGAKIDEYTSDAIERLFTLQESGFPNPQRDILRCVTVRDATLNLTEESALALCEIKTYSLKSEGEMRAKPWSNYAECLKPGIEMSTEIRIDIDKLEKMIEEYGYRRKVEQVFGNSFTQSDILDRIQAAITATGNDISKYAQELTSGFDQISSFYTDLMSEDEPSLRVGFGTGWFSNTVGTAMDKHTLLQIRSEERLGKPTYHDDCGGILVSDDHNPDKLFCIDCYTGNIDPDSSEASSTPFPKTRRFVQRDGTATYPLGWLQMEFSSP